MLQVHVDKHEISATLTNTGQTLLLTPLENNRPANITGGPLSYNYQFR